VFGLAKREIGDLNSPGRPCWARSWVRICQGLFNTGSVQRAHSQETVRFSSARDAEVTTFVQIPFGASQIPFLAA